MVYYVDIARQSIQFSGMDWVTAPSRIKTLNFYLAIKRINT